jgi:hypothetical protein
MRLFVFLAATIAGAIGCSAIARADVIPRGSYQATCSDFYTDGNTLWATCRTRYGDSIDTSLHGHNSCEGDIANIDGRLTCVDDRDDDWSPRGSYRNTCRRINVEERTLEAECQDRFGRWRYTELDNFRLCRGDIFNLNGILGCRRGDADDDNDGGVNLPGGNWRQSCRNARLYRRILYAQCRDFDGDWRDVSVDLRQCYGGVSYWRGRLVCAQGGGYGAGRVTLYRHPNYAGNSRTYVADIPNLNVYAFGNQASSVVIQGGVWQICDLPYYRGSCVVLDRTVPDLSAYRFNDRAESVRRVR